MELSLNGDLKIYYELIDGNNELPYLIFLHDGLGCCKTWKTFPEKLCRLTGCPGLLYDRTGYGWSSPCKTPRTLHYLHACALIELPAVLRTLIEGKPYILTGHSDGGTIALIHASERPPLLRAVVSEAAHIFVEPETVAGIKRTCHAFQNGQLQGLNRCHGEKTVRVFNDWAQTWLSDWFQQWNIEYLLPAINSPLLLIQGIRDEYATTRQLEIISGSVSGSSLTMLVDDCGHIPHREQHQTVLQTVTAFIRDTIC